MSLTESPTAERTCKTCGETKPLAEFTFAVATKSGGRQTGHHCRPCHRKRCYAAQFKGRYGITLEDRDAMYAAQNKRCAICNVEKPLGGRTGLALDHDHSTRRARALLCPGCNTLVAALEHGMIDLVAAYLERHDQPVS